MKLEVLRFNSQDDFTNGLLFDVTDNVRSFLAYTLEDEARTTKVWGETRIPAGKYKLSLKQHGGFHNRYRNKYGSEWHKGMIYVNDVPQFEDILWHVGNSDEDTAGCLLVGQTSQENFIGSSVAAYKSIYPPIRDAILNGDEVTVNYIDFDGKLDQKKSKDTSPVVDSKEDVMNILSTEIKSLKSEIKGLRQAIILKGLQVK
jgi:hypothetical protein